MKAYVVKENGILEYTDVAAPQIKEDEVLVKVMSTGICGSDIPRIYNNGAYFYPLICGHEFSGVVENVGVGADPKLKGKRVGVFPLLPCHNCDQCRRGKYELCRKYGYLGSRQDGGFAEYVAVPAWNLIEIPEGVGFDAGAMMEPMCVAVHAMRRVQISKDDRIVVFGAGTIGLFMLTFLLEAGYENVFVIGNKDLQKKMACELGLRADDFGDSRIVDVGEWIKEKTDGAGADVLFECVGRNETINQCLQSAAYEAQIVFVGNPASDMQIDKKDHWAILRRQLRITGTWNSSFTHSEDDDWHYVMKRLAAGRVDPSRFITHKMSFEDLGRGFEIMRDKSEEYIKVMSGKS